MDRNWPRMRPINTWKMRVIIWIVRMFSIVRWRGSWRHLSFEILAVSFIKVRFVIVCHVSWEINMIVDKLVGFELHVNFGIHRFRITSIQLCNCSRIIFGLEEHLFKTFMTNLLIFLSSRCERKFTKHKINMCKI